MTTESPQPGLGGAAATIASTGDRRANARSRSPLLFGAGLVVAALLTAVTTFFAVSGIGPLAPASPVMLWLLCTSLVITAFLGGVVVLRIVRIARARSTPDTGARLHLRFVSLFSVAAVAPALIVAVFMGAALSRGVEEWFSQRFKTVVENAAVVGKSYIQAVTESVRGEVLAMATDLNRAEMGLYQDKTAYTEYLRNQAQLRFFPVAYVIDARGRVLAAAESDNAPRFVPPSHQAFKDAAGGDVAMKFAPNDMILALYRLKDYDDAYLYIASPVEKGIFAKLQQFDESVKDWRNVERSSARLETLFTLSYLNTAVLVLLGAIWLGLSNASAIAEPIGRLAEAAGRVADGDLDARVPAAMERDEVDALGRAFNRMTGQLQAQRADLVRARQDAEQRSGFISAVLSGVSAGVLGLDANGRVNAANRSAATLLGMARETLIGRRLIDVAPEFADLMNLPPVTGNETIQRRVDLTQGGALVHLSVRIGADPGGAGLVLTFDDMTKLISAQRQEAWKDVARRIAHEIKNPLTPIQLSAERLRRKYAGEITSDAETFERCIDTIMRQVLDIRRMVDEFSTFARMPTPTLAEENLSQIVREIAYSQRIAFADTRFEVSGDDKPIIVACDGRLIAQALTNVTKNAAEAIETRREREGEPKEGLVQIRLSDLGQTTSIEVIDNGIGFPGAERARLVEPYVTTRAKGTGLGLAIVQRVIEDHGGALELEDAPGPGPGALVRILLPKQQNPAASAPVEAEKI